MTKIDQFESVFQAAAKEVYSHRDIELQQVMVLSDQDAAGHDAFKQQVQGFLSVLDESTQWHDVRGDDYRHVQSLLDLVQEVRPDLICTYRNLHTETWRWPYSLGDHIDVLTQETNVPIFLAPHPKKEGTEWPKNPLKEVMAVTDQVTGDDRLIQYSVRFTPPGGKLFISHVEDADIFERYIGFISKIPEIDTDLARELIKERIFNGPNDFIESCQTALKEAGIDLTLEGIVTLGHFLKDYQSHIREREIDLVVMNTKDDDQLAMHGLAYPLAVEVRNLPLLML